MSAMKPSHRPLKVYAFDPTRGTTLGNQMTVQVEHEELRPGPVGGRLEVIDHDGTNGVQYPPVDLDDRLVLLQGGLPPSETNPQFHQQMAYAVASETIANFESALGRRIGFHCRSRRQQGEAARRLRLFPHAMEEANAYYSHEMGAVLFGYFASADDPTGRLVPGQTVFTCLSHDIVAHEVTHAILDQIKEHFGEDTGPDVLAFHEAFADLVALFQHFTFEEALVDAIQRTGGLLFLPTLQPDAPGRGRGRARIQAEIARENPMVELARQFGEALGTRRALRSAIGTRPGSQDYHRLTEPHERGSILVAAVFDAYFTSFIGRTRDLLRIARAGGATVQAGDLHPDLARRLAQEAQRTARHFLHMCIRALDYCPPIDITFGDYLRALITSDIDLVPLDEHGYRQALVDAFRSRGIRPTDVPSLAEESLRWDEPPTPVTIARLDLTPRPDREWRDQQKENAMRIVKQAKAQAAALRLDVSRGAKVQAFHFRPVQRIGPHGRVMHEAVVELMQQRKEELEPGGPAFTFRGGTTLLLDEQGGVRYAVHKSITDERRLAAQKRWMLERDLVGAERTYGLGPRGRALRTRIDFARLHGGF